MAMAQIGRACEASGQKCPMNANRWSLCYHSRASWCIHWLLNLCFCLYVNEKSLIISGTSVYICFNRCKLKSQSSGSPSRWNRKEKAFFVFTNICLFHRSMVLGVKLFCHLVPFFAFPNVWGKPYALLDGLIECTKLFALVVISVL